MIRNKIYDGTHTSPVNTTAGKAVSGGTHYTPNKKIVQQHWENPPKTITVPPHIENLTGVQFGRFTVVGLLEKPRKKYQARGGLWLVRCACSHFESRRTKSVLNPKNNQDRCEYCRHQAHLQRVQEFLTTGKNRDHQR